MALTISRLSLLTGLCMISVGASSADRSKLMGEQALTPVPRRMIIQDAASEPFDLNIGRVRVRLELTTLAEVTHQLHTGSVVQSGDAGESLERLCYSFASPNKKMWVVLESSEMGGDVHAITGYTLSTIDPDVAQCAPTTVPPSDVVMANGISIGMTQVAFSRTMGAKNLRQRGNIVTFDDSTYVAPTPTNPREAITGYGLRARFVGDTLAEIYAWQVTAD